MASKQAVVAAVAMVYGAAGRNYGETELNLYRIALADITDEDVTEAAVAVVRGVDLGDRAPSPAMLRQAVEAAHRRAALEVGPPTCDACESTGWVDAGDGYFTACTVCAQFVRADPNKKSLPRRGRDLPDPLALGASLKGLEAARKALRPKKEAS